ncbi:uncharacterized protein LOC121377997 [Gigantopelta aegis]|uniref:uncharacterized protein LOC121377997 n=1 Tax=Gigantopelta aegis TaxID=1735272 RepID=UPI001B88A618|nr:uncharacterized protein LOC121377997 [Gigantopelta aegis]
MVQTLSDMASTAVAKSGFQRRVAFLASTRRRQSWSTDDVTSVMPIIVCGRWTDMEGGVLWYGRPSLTLAEQTLYMSQMKCTLLLILLVALTISHPTEGKIRLRKIWHKIKAIAEIINKLRKRDLAEFENNMDGLTDQLQLEDALDTPVAREILNEDGNSEASMEEFQRFIAEMSKVE